MTSEKPVEIARYTKVVYIVGIALIALLEVATFAFGLPRDIGQAAVNLVMIGYMLFMVIDSLRTKRPVLAAVVAAILALHLAIIFL